MTCEPYHPDKVWTWPKEEQQAYQDRIQPLIDAACDDDPGEQNEPEIELTPAGFNYLLPGVEPIRNTPPTSGQARLF